MTLEVLILKLLLFKLASLCCFLSNRIINGPPRNAPISTSLLAFFWTFMGLIFLLAGIFYA